MLINKMATNRHATSFLNHNMFICVFISLLLPMANEGASNMYSPDNRRMTKEKNEFGGTRLTKEYHLRQGALRGLIVKPSWQYDLQYVEMFLGIPYAAPPLGSLRFMPPVSAPPWPGTKMATQFAPVCPQTFPQVKKENPPSKGRQLYMSRLKTFLLNESEDCLYLNIYVPYREQKVKKFPILVFIHGDSFGWSSGNPYDGRMLAAYGNIMVITINFRLGILGFMKPSLTEHVYGNNGLLDQLAALQWIKDNIVDINGDPTSVTLMGHGTGAACVSFMMLSPISDGLFLRAILMSGSALSDWAMTKDPTQYTLQVAQSLGCSLNSKNMMMCLQKKPLSEIKKVQILAREFETPLGPIVAGSFIPSEPANTMASFPNLLSKYQLMSGVTELERYHDFGVIELEHGVLDTQRDDFIRKYSNILFERAEHDPLNTILKQYAPSKLDPQRWNVDVNRDVILDILSDAQTLDPVVRFANYHSASNEQSFFYVFGHNSVSSEYAALNKSVHGQELPYIFGVPLGVTNTHFAKDFTQQERLLSEVMMRMWTNFVKYGTPNTQKSVKFYTLDKRQWSLYNLNWPEYDQTRGAYLRFDIPPTQEAEYRVNYTNFWSNVLPDKMRKFIVDPLFSYESKHTTQKQKPAPKPALGANDPTDRFGRVRQSRISETQYSSAYGKLRPFSQPTHRQDQSGIYKAIMSIEKPVRPVPSGIVEKVLRRTTTAKQKETMSVKTSSATMTLIISLCILFLLVNAGICSVLYFKKRKIRLDQQGLSTPREPRAERGEVDVIGQKSFKEERALQTLKNGCNAIKRMSITQSKNNPKKTKKNKTTTQTFMCKTPKSDDSGGFRDRFQLRRHLSTSTLDAHTKVRDWITNEMMHRCSPGNLSKSNSDFDDKHLAEAKLYTRSEELLSDSKRKKNDIKVSDRLDSKILDSTTNSRNQISKTTKSSSALGSYSTVESNKESETKTESNKSKKISVAIDATPAARTNSILNQEPIETLNLFDANDEIHSNSQQISTETVPNDETKVENNEKTFTNVVNLSVEEKPLIISHKHSSSDPVGNLNYEKLKRKIECDSDLNILPPVTFRNDVNVTSREEKFICPLTAEESLLNIQMRKFPKVLPDLPKGQKRLSLQSFGPPLEGQTKRPRVPPQPPPRTTTLERRHRSRNTKLLSSFDAADKNKISCDTNYENINNLSPSVEPSLNENKQNFGNQEVTAGLSKERLHKIIITSDDILPTHEKKVLISPSKQVDIPTDIPRVRLPDNFHSSTQSSVTSFSSDNDDYDEDEIADRDFEDKLIQELVGGVDSPTNMNINIVFDSKGPETIDEKKLEIVPVKINPGVIVPNDREDYICVTNLLLPDVTSLEKTAQIKPNFSLNKLKHRTESIHRPPEKAVKVKQRRSKSSSILNKHSKGKWSMEKIKNISDKLQHSNSGSSNDTETSTGTVKNVSSRRQETIV